MALTGITLRIYSGSLAGGLDHTAIVSVGSLPESFKPLPPIIVDEEISWSITHAQEYTAYTLHSKQFKTKDGLPGQLLICLLLPPNQRLAEEKEPLTMLNSVLDVFAVQPQVCGVLPNAPIDNSSFSMLVKRYSLEERPRLLPLMKGAEPAAFQPSNHSQLIALMRYSHYPALSKVARLELGMKCQSTIVLPMGGGSGLKVQKPAKAMETVKETEKEPAEKVSVPTVERNRPVKEETTQPKEEVKETEKQEVLSNGWNTNTTRGGEGLSLDDGYDDEYDDDNHHSEMKVALIIAALALFFSYFWYSANNNNDGFSSEAEAAEVVDSMQAVEEAAAAVEAALPVDDSVEQPEPLF